LQPVSFSIFLEIFKIYSLQFSINIFFSKSQILFMTDLDQKYPDPTKISGSETQDHENHENSSVALTEEKLL